jgi:hypothetical protein
MRSAVDDCDRPNSARTTGASGADEAPMPRIRPGEVERYEDLRGECNEDTSTRISRRPIRSRIELVNASADEPEMPSYIFRIRALSGRMAVTQDGKAICNTLHFSRK